MTRQTHRPAQPTALLAVLAMLGGLTAGPTHAQGASPVQSAASSVSQTGHKVAHAVERGGRQVRQKIERGVQKTGSVVGHGAQKVGGAVQRNVEKVTGPTPAASAP